MSRVSAVPWRHFSRVEGGLSAKAVCKYCEAEVGVTVGGRGRGASHTLRRHLETLHPEVLGPEDEEEAGVPSTSSPVQGNLLFGGVGGWSSLLGRLGPLSNLEPPYDLKLLKFISEGLHPNDLVGDPRFLGFLSLMKRSSAPPLPPHRGLLRPFPRERLRSLAHFSLSLELHPSESSPSLSLWIGYLDSSSGLNVDFLSSVRLPEDADPRELARVLRREVSRSPVAVVSGYNPELTRALKINKWEYVPCPVHWTNAALEEGLKKIRPLVEKVEAVVHFLKTGVAPSDLLQRLGENKSAYSEGDPASTYELLSRASDCRESIDYILGKYGDDEFRIYPAEWEAVGQATAVLGIFLDLLESPPRATLPWTRLLLKSLSDSLRAFVGGRLLQEPVREMSSLLLRTTGNALRSSKKLDSTDDASLLDPRLKKIPFLGRTGRFRRLIDSLLERMRVSGSDEEEIRKELDSYLERPLVPESRDPLDWWREESHLFPNLSPFALRVATLPASCAPFERFADLSHRP